MNDLYKSLNLFFKRHKTVGMSLTSLYEDFQGTYKEQINQAEFELALLKLKKRTVNDLRVVCLRYKESPYGYYKFIREQQHITKELWLEITGVAADVRSTPKKEIPKKEISVTKRRKKGTHVLDLLPDNWGLMHWVHKEQFINTCENTELLKAIMPTETAWAVKSACQQRLTALHDLSVEQPAVSKQSSLSMTPENYADLMPLDWGKMDFSRRLDFAKEIQDLDFRQYILSKDSRLRNYFEKMKAPKDNVKMCRIIFSAPLDPYPPKARKLVSDVIDSLNRASGAGLEYVEFQNTKTMEIRQVLR